MCWAPYGWPWEIAPKGGFSFEDVYLPGDGPTSVPLANFVGDTHYACVNDLCFHAMGDKGCVVTTWEIDREDPYRVGWD